MLAAGTQSQPQPAPPTPGDLEAEVRDNILNQRLGDGPVADLALPDEFLRRVADRIVRSSYEERYRIVVKDAEAPTSLPSKGSGQTIWIALFAAAVALLAVGWASIARRKGAGAS